MMARRRSSFQPRQAVHGVGQSVEVETSGEDLPDRHEQDGGEQRREDGQEHPVGEHETGPQRESDHGEPPRGPSERSRSLRLLARHGHDGEKSQREDEVAHWMTITGGGGSARPSHRRYGIAS